MNAAKAGIGRAFYELNDKVRVGYGQINSSSRTVDGVDTTTLRSGVRKYSSTVKSNFFDWLYNIPKTSSGTPLRRAMDDVGIYYSRAKGQYSPWADNPGDANYGGFKTCRQSYHILMTDGYWKDAAATIGRCSLYVLLTIFTPPDSQDFALLGSWL